jgi:hypothetical protein
MVLQAERILEKSQTLKGLNESYLREYLNLTNSDKSIPFYGNITLIFENNKAERVKEERLRKL